MFKNFIPILILTLVASTASAAEPRPATPTPTAETTTTEVRYVSAPGHRKGAKVSKLIITRDANGKIISVKRG
jgi:hypothetical protein